MYLNSSVLSIAFIISTASSNKQTFFEFGKGYQFQGKNIAIVGGGAGGSSAAYYLSELEDKLKYRLSVDLYEASDRIGGRAESIVVNGENIELGGTCFVDVNYNIQEACEKFNIEKVDLSGTDGTIGLFDGEKFVITFDNSYWSSIKFYYRYGYSAYRTQNAANKLRDQFLKLYQKDTPGFNSIEELFNYVNLLNYTTWENRDFLINEVGTSEIFVDEFYQAVTRNIYSISNKLHTLAGSAAFVAMGTREGIKGGNYKLFEAFIKHSKATPYLYSKVTDIREEYDDDSNIKYRLHTNGSPLDNLYDIVIIATPLHLSGIKLPENALQDFRVEYRDVYVGVITNASLNPTYFGVKTEKEIPETILGFSTSSPLAVVTKSDGVIFLHSLEPITYQLLSKVLIKIPSRENIYRKHWKAYPIMNPIQKFPPVVLHKNIYYVNAMEPALATMETETVSSRNIVKLIEKSLSQELTK